MTSTQNDNRPTNHLAGESSPYLLSHAHNPVAWYPWGEKAFALARELDRPIFLSIGYAACHWCHVMERESFENKQIAAFLNENFVSIKVDREQRPDLDHIYMAFTQAMAGNGGWPMSVFLTPDLKPFFAGTYFPPDDYMGRPGFKRVLTEIASAYREQRDQIVESADSIFAEIGKHLSTSPEVTPLAHNLLDQAGSALMRSFDHMYGGFGQAPKFPHPMELSLFLRLGRRTGDLGYLLAAEKALQGMAHGGIYDHIGGGFARYSTDERWLVPHFEKMLYDNALLVPVYAEAYQITHNEFYRKIVTGVLDFILNELTDSGGGFYSSLDADSEGEEGRFYVWSRSELDNLLGSDSDLFCQYYNATPQGNFENRNILHVNAQSNRAKLGFGLTEKAFSDLLDRCRERLRHARSQRIRPLTDDKILTSWNGLSLAAFCRGYQITRDSRYLNAAIANAEFVKKQMFRDSQLRHSYRQGVCSEGQFLEDYAYYLQGLIELYQIDSSHSDRHRLDWVTHLAQDAIKLFLGPQDRFYLRPDNQPDLIFRPHEETDSALPAAGSVMILNLLKLEQLTGLREFGEFASRALNSLSGLMTRYAVGMTSALKALDYQLSERVEIVITGENAIRDQMLTEIYSRYLPNAVIAVAASNDGESMSPLFKNRFSPDRSARACVCRNSVCRLPASTVEDLREQLHNL